MSVVLAIATLIVGPLLLAVGLTIAARRAGPRGIWTGALIAAGVLFAVSKVKPDVVFHYAGPKDAGGVWTINFPIAALAAAAVVQVCSWVHMPRVVIGLVATVAASFIVVLGLWVS
jgi:hypothetical protein